MATVLDQSYNPTINDANTLRFGVATHVKLAVKFTPSKSAGVNQVKLRLHNDGAGAGNVWAEIWSDSGGAPSAQLGSNSSTQDATAIASDPGAQYTFTFASSIACVSGTPYWIVLNGDYGFDTTSINFRGATSGSADGYPGADYNGSSWSTTGTGYAFEEYYDSTTTTSPSLSPSASQSPSASASRSASASASASASKSASASESKSLSPSSSASPSASPSASGSSSTSASASKSLSPSASTSASESKSLSPSASGSASGSASSSLSLSPSASGSASGSASFSPSASLSQSASASASPSPARYVNEYSTIGNTYTDEYSSTF